MTDLLPFDDLRLEVFVHLHEHGGYWLAMNRDGLVYWNGQVFGFLHNVLWEASQHGNLHRLPKTMDEARAHFPKSDAFIVIEEAPRHD